MIIPIRPDTSTETDPALEAVQDDLLVSAINRWGESTERKMQGLSKNLRTMELRFAALEAAQKRMNVMVVGALGGAAALIAVLIGHLLK